MTRYLAPVLATLIFGACQSANDPVTPEMLPDPRVASGQPRFPDLDATAVAEETPAVVVADEEVAVVTPTETTTADNCTADATSPGAVGDPCATTRSFMEGLGMNDEQIASVIAAGQDLGAVAH